MVKPKKISINVKGVLSRRKSRHGGALSSSAASAGAGGEGGSERGGGAAAAVGSVASSSGDEWRTASSSLARESSADEEASETRSVRSGRSSGRGSSHDGGAAQAGGAAGAGPRGGPGAGAGGGRVRRRAEPQVPTKSAPPPARRTAAAPIKPAAAPPSSPPPPRPSRTLSEPLAVPPESGPDERDGDVLDASYETVPLLEIVDLPRGGVSVETQAVGHVQFGIPPETIKDSMRLGIAVPSVYIVPVDRFCREMGPALGVNLAEFEFPAYFNFFVQRKRCTLIVDSVDAEMNIRRVFAETLLGPAQFRRGEKPLTHEEEDFAPDFPREAIPNFYEELKHFRIMPNGKELVLETLLKFCHFESAPDSSFRDNLGAPPLDRNASEDNNGNPKGGSEGVQEEAKSSHGGEGGKKAAKTLKYTQIRWIGDVAKIYPSDAPEDQIAQNKTKRVEIFKMPSGSDYVLHDIDENNIIVGKARFSETVRVTEGIRVIGLEEEQKMPTPMGLGGALMEGSVFSPPPTVPSFNPPSFGVTVLGNSHGFDKSGSTSGYVLWINGRGVMIDPPPYSSATLEREGIRPRTIVGIILTHCHADHDAGAFQKVLTGSPVVVITTPTIYKSFIRKYAALSSLSPALLRHSHRYKPAIIGEPLRFQGAAFHFTYMLHTIPCVGFRVDWRGRSMVFTGDHFNNPPALQKLVEKGVLSKTRYADLNHFPMQQTDLLLHEAGAPPIHTPLDVLLKLPEEVKQRLYVVHTSALPEGCDLRVAPTGTAGTIRLDQIRRGSGSIISSISSKGGGAPESRPGMQKKRPSIFESNSQQSTSFLRLGDALMGLEDVDEYAESELFNPTPNAYAHLLTGEAAEAAQSKQQSEPPPVSLRPTSSSDAWFILNLLSAVPFLSSLSYSSTMEVLETAKVSAYSCNQIVLAADRRSKYLVVVWEGTLMERERIDSSFTSHTSLDDGKENAVWYAGDWTGPRILQPDKKLSGESSTSTTHDIFAMSAEGVKAIVVDLANLHTILKSGSPLYRKYHLGLSQRHTCKIPSAIPSGAAKVFKDAVRNLNIIELLGSNTGLSKLTAVQKRSLECLAEGPAVYAPGQRLWRAGSVVDKAFIVVAGTVAFVPKRRHGGSAGKGIRSSHRVKQTHETRSNLSEEHIGEAMRNDAVKAVRELQASVKMEDDILQEESQNGDQGGHGSSLCNSLTETEEYNRLSRGLQKWAERHESQGSGPGHARRRGSASTDASPELSLHDFCDSTVVQEEKQKQKQKRLAERKDSDLTNMSESSHRRQSDTKIRFANKVLGRLYNRRGIGGDLKFSKGHFLGDIEKMVHGLLSSDNDADPSRGDNNDELPPLHGFGENDDALSQETMTIHELEDGQQACHSSTLAAGKDGCVVLILPKASLQPFLDEHPGWLLSLLGRQVMV